MTWRPLEWAVAAIVALAIAVTIADTAADDREAQSVAVATKTVSAS